MTEKFLILLFFIFLFVPSAFADESITITTYYPSPYGSYNNLTTGNFTVSNNVTFATTAGSKVGIGTAAAPVAKLDVEGGSANWNELTPGLATGSIHLDPGSASDHYGSAFTWGASDSSNGETAQAGIYVRSDGSYGTKMYLATTDAYVSGSKTRMMIDSNGNVGIGTVTPTPGYQLDVINNIRAGNNIYAGNNIDAGNNINAVNAISTPGNVYTHDGGVHSSSDIRLKDVTGNYTRGLVEILNLNPIDFHYKSGNELGFNSTKQSIGLSAQEVQSLIPEAVEVGDKGYLTLTQGPIVYAMINAVKELNGKVNLLSASTTKLFSVFNISGAPTSTPSLMIDGFGNVGIGTAGPTSKLQVVGLLEYADNAAAISAGLTVGSFYRTGDILKVVH